MNPIKPKSLAIFKSGCEKFPKTAITLLDIMRELDAINVFQFERIIEERIKDAEMPEGEFLSEDVANLHYALINSIFGDKFTKLEWKEAEYSLSGLNLTLQGSIGEKKVSAESVRIALRELQRAIHKELRARKFVMVENAKAQLLEQRAAFGVWVNIRFPSAREEIKSAANCLALDLNTAAVFHLMRAAEFGMRALAIHLKVKLKRKPIEHGGWSEIIEQIENKIRERRQRYDKSRKKNKKELKFLKFCRMMADELYIFKEIWRDNTMHSISSYNESEAKGVFERVKDFMQRLSKEVSETK